MEIVDRRVPLSEIGKTVGPAPVPRFVENVRRNGVVIPILLREVVADDGEVEYRIVDGNRRVAAARKAGSRDIPARILLGVSVDEAARLVLLANNFRSSNDLTEYWAIKHLERSGVNRQRIADDAGINLQYLGLRDRWSTLDRRIFGAFAEGKLPASVVNKIVRMKPVDQSHFGDLFQRTGRILAADIQDYLRDRKPLRHTNETGIRSDHQETNGMGGGEDASSYNGAPPKSPEMEEPPVVIVTSGPVMPLSNADPDVEAIPREMPGQLPPDIQQAIEHAAHLGYTQGLSLADLSGALAIAYRHVALVEKTYKEGTRG